jgi:CRISPR/Cas system-associated endonuclease Cas3-HD
LGKLLKEIDLINKEIEEASELLKLENIIKELIDVQNKIDEKKENYSELYSLLNLIVEVNKDIEWEENSYNELHKKFEESFPNVCPLCGKPK